MALTDEAKKHRGILEHSAQSFADLCQTLDPPTRMWLLATTLNRIAGGGWIDEDVDKAADHLVENGAKFIQCIAKSVEHKNWMTTGLPDIDTPEGTERNTAVAILNDYVPNPGLRMRTEVMERVVAAIDFGIKSGMNAGLTLAVVVAKGAKKNYRGGHDGEFLEAYRHGIDTIIRCIQVQRDNPERMQALMNYAVGEFANAEKKRE